MLRNRAHSLTEVLVASSILIILFASCLGAFILTKAICATSTAEYEMQRDVNTIMTRIIKGMKEQSDVFGLRSAQSYNIPSVGRINFVGMDNNTRSYFLNNNAITYISPTQSPNQKTIYTAPADSNVILRFWNPYIGQPINDNATVGIYLSVSRRISDRTVSGSLSTYVNLKNMPK